MASVFLNDLDDYIQPSQACVNPLFTSSSQTANADASPASARIVLQTDKDMDFMQPQQMRPDLIRSTGTGNGLGESQQKATVSLDDCLACSGCVTSAEAVLISQQSFKEMLQVLQSKQFTRVVITISPQSRASLATHFGLSCMTIHRRLVTVFRSLGAHLVIDSTCFSDMALLESRAEFVHRFRNQQPTKWAKPPASLALSSTKTEFIGGQPQEALQDPLRAIPMLASSCPGWICYAEKTQPNAIPFIDTTKSPQQIAGAVIKQLVSREADLSPQQVYHITVMPCFDKKLEASRKDFYDEITSTKDVDCVLATTEVLELIQFQQVDFMALEEAQLTSEELLLSGIVQGQDGQQHAVASHESNAHSGGQLEHIFRYAARELFGVEVNGPLEYVSGRNSDFKEVSLVVNGQEVLKFALAYGFRNIQTIMTRLRRNKCTYHYVEIMACPSGCLNGGGQLKPASSLEASRLVNQVREKYMENLVVRDPLEDPLCKYLYEKYFEGQPFASPAVRQVLHTRYHAVPKLEQSNPLGIKW